MNKLKNTVIIILAVLLSVLAFLYAIQKPEIRYIERNIYDTLIKQEILPSEIVYIEGNAIIESRTLVIHDTIEKQVIYETPAFTAKLDTIVKDTFNLAYDYPENIFRFVMKPVPDTIKTVLITNTIFEKEKLEWWQPYAYIFGGSLIGYLANEIGDK